jgi:hypothetical protein
MKKCNCLRYEALRANRRNESVYIFLDDGLYPVEAIFPLEDFKKDSGELITKCPLYNYLHDGKLIYRAYNKMIDKEITADERKIILDAVAECSERIEVKKFLIFSERNKEILDMFCERHNIRMTWRLLKEYLNFFKDRRKFKDEGKCKDIPADQKKKCFDELWLDSFREYLKYAKFNIPE